MKKIVILIILLLITFGNKSVYAKDCKELISAAKRGKYAEVNKLIDEGCNLEIFDLFGMTPLVWSAGKGHIKVANLLINSGVNIDAPERMFGKTALMFSIEKDQIKSVNFLIEKGTNVETRDKVGYTALMWATMKNNVDAIKILLKNGANPNAKVNSGKFVGQTALKIAEDGGYPEIVMMLKGAGAKE